ncbi:MAG: BrnT family toxin [Alphaproteobacteria bacterium]|nr:BrnT family toxin [Alphaproteobacteria bacterium]
MERPTRWIWDPRKASANRAKHGVSFEAAVRVFDDPLHLSALDPHPDGDRWRTLGLVGRVVLFVVHTGPEEGVRRGETVGRIIGARKATSHEGRAYEESPY